MKDLLITHVKRIGCWIISFLFIVQVANAQNQVSGQVNDESGQAMPGVNVIIKGTAQGTVTDGNGSFALNVPENAVLQFTFIGYAAEEVAVNGQATINVVLTEDITSLQEVVVVGYGVQKKSDLTGAVASVSQKELTQIATPDVVGALSGRVAGVNITPMSGEPGSGTKIRVRGVTSINNSNPLYVVDGFQNDDISYLNPNDIESIEILKDASATAIYGSRGAAGVVLITTKKSKSGVPQLMFDGYVGIQSLANKLDMVDAAGYSTLRMEAYENDGVDLEATDPVLFTRLNYVRENGFEGTDWQKEITRQAKIQNYSLSVIGGNDNHKYNISGTYFGQDGIIKNTDMQKVFFRINNDFKFTKWLDMGLDLSYMNLDQTNYSNDLYAGGLPVAVRADPVTPAWDEPSNNWGRPDISQNNNPARIVDEFKYLKNYEHYFIANIYGQAKITNALSFRTQFGATLKNAKREQYFPEFFIATDEARSESILAIRNSESKTWMWSNFLTYNKSFGDHSITGMVGIESQLAQQSRVTEGKATQVPLDENLRFFSSAKGTQYTLTSNQSDATLQSYFARANYSFKGRYMATATIRYDGSSKVEEEYRWGTFPSFSVGWNISEEPFMENIEQVSMLKVRAGWGQVGNLNSLAPYRTTTTLSGNQLYSFGSQSVQGAAALSLSNAELQWETSEMTNLGIDVGAFNDKLSFTADYFKRTTKDMIYTVPVPSYVGAGRPSANAFTMEGTGIELSVGYRNNEGVIRYEVNGNIAFIGNEITDLAQGIIEDGNVGHVGNTTRTEEGYEIAYFYGRKTNGIFNDQAELDAHVNEDGEALQPSAQPGDVKFVDTNFDGIINDNDRTFLGSGTPDFTFGFSASVGYKNFDLRVLVTGSQGNEAINALSRFNQASNGLENSRQNRMDRWTAENPNSNEPRMTTSDPNKNIETFSDRYVEDASFVRMKNIQLGYNFPATITEKLKLSTLRLYLSVDNVFTVTKYTGFDPEFGDLFGNPLYYGVDQATYPNPRIFRAGINLKL